MNTTDNKEIKKSTKVDDSGLSGMLVIVIIIGGLISLVVAPDEFIYNFKWGIVFLLIIVTIVLLVINNRK